MIITKLQALIEKAKEMKAKFDDLEFSPTAIHPALSYDDGWIDAVEKILGAKP